MSIGWAHCTKYSTVPEFLALSRDRTLTQKGGV
jgi:hypothetical protein